MVAALTPAKKGYEKTLQSLSARGDKLIECPKKKIDCGLTYSGWI